MKYLFNYQKYRKWRKEHEQLDDATLDTIERFNNYEVINGEEYESLWKLGHIILKDWCDYVE